MEKRVRFSSPTKRGLILVRTLLVNSFDANTPPSETTVARWTKKQVREFNVAMAWLEQVKSDLEAKAGAAC